MLRTGSAEAAGSGTKGHTSTAVALSAAVRGQRSASLSTPKSSATRPTSSTPIYRSRSTEESFITVLAAVERRRRFVVTTGITITVSGLLAALLALFVTAND